MRHVLCMLAIAWACVNASAQDSLPPWMDTLVHRIERSHDDPAKLNLYIELLDQAAPSERELALQQGEAALQLARSRDLKQEEIRLLITIGRMHWQAGHFAEALAVHEEALRSARAFGTEEQVGTLLGYIALDHIDAGHHARAIPPMQEALSYYRRTGNKGQQIYIHGLLGYTYMAQGDPAACIREIYAQRRINEELGDTVMMALCSSNIGEVELQMGHAEEALRLLNEALDLQLRPGTVPDMNTALTYVHIGDAHLYLRRTAEARDAYDAAIRISNAVMDRTAAGLAHRGLAKICDAEGDPARALANYEQAATNLERAGFNKTELANIYARIGMLHARLGNMAEGRRYLLRIDSLSRDMASRNILSDLHRTSEYLDSTRADWRGAYIHHKLFAAYQDSILGEENRDQIAKAQVRYESEKKMLADSLSFAADKAIQVREIQKQKVIRNGFVGGFALVALFAWVFFFQRNRINKEKKRSEELLLNILPEEVAEELKAKGEAEAVHIDQVTVLFTDFKGFTAMSEKLTPKELVHDLHECFSAFDRIAEKHGIEKIKTIGDAYMAAGGLPTPNTTHATDVIQAAFEMRDFIAEGKARKQAAGLPYFEIRIGVHTGPVVAGIVGVKKFSYDIWGDTVNTASRMESSGEVGQVNISEATYALVKAEPGLTFTPRGKVQAKGKGEMEMYFVRND
jgi:adenylate cyclase